MGWFRFVALDCVRGDEIETNVLGLGGPLIAARELDELGDEHGHLLELLGDVAQQALALSGRQLLVPREHLDVGAQARQRRAQLVRGVGDELSLRLRRRLERREHRVEGRGEARELVAPVLLDSPREVARLRHLLSGVGETAHRREHRARDDDAKRGGDGHADERDEEQPVADPRERAVHLVERSRDLQCVPPLERRRQHPHVRPLDMGIGEERLLPLPRRGVAVALGDRQLNGLTDRADRLAVAGHDLQVASGATEKRRRHVEKPTSGRADPRRSAGASSRPVPRSASSISLRSSPRTTT